MIETKTNFFERKLRINFFCSLVLLDPGILYINSCIFNAERITNNYQTYILFVMFYAIAYCYFLYIYFDKLSVMQSVTYTRERHDNRNKLQLKHEFSYIVLVFTCRYVDSKSVEHWIMKNITMNYIFETVSKCNPKKNCIYLYNNQKKTETKRQQKNTSKGDRQCQM